MGTVRSQSDLSDWRVDGVTLGVPATDPDTGELLWDHETVPQMTLAAPATVDPDDLLLLGLLGGAA